MNRIALRANITILLAMLLLAGFVFFLVEYAVEAEDWATFTGSPHVYNGNNIGTGVVTDRNGVLLLDMSQDRTYAESQWIRMSTVHWLGDRNGSVDAPALATYSGQMAGYDILTGMYTYGDDHTGMAKLSLSADVQTAALDAMGDYKGTVAVYNYKTGEIICSVTTPTFDPDNVPEVDDDNAGSYEGMYLNRFTQSVYIPGSIFKVVTLAAALEHIPDIQEQTFVCQGTYEMGEGEDNKIVCEVAHGKQDLKTAFRNSCNCAFAQISQQLGGKTLEKYVEQFGVIQSVTFDGITTSKGNYEATNASQASVAWSSIGQYHDEINACSFLTFIGAIAGGGQGVQPYLVSEVFSGDTATYTAETKTEKRIMSQETAQTVREFMAFNVEDKYGAENFPGLTVCAKTGTAEVGGGKKPNAMLVGFVEDSQYPLAFIACIEDGGYGSTVCIPIVSKVLEACKTALD